MSNFIGASCKLDAKWMMHHHDDLSMLMVASAGEADRFSTKNKLSSISAVCLVALETQSSFMLVQFYHTIGYEPNVSSKKD